jgi:hypothetical protein
LDGAIISAAVAAWIILDGANSHRERRFAGTQEDMKTITPIGSGGSLEPKKI